MNYQDLYTRACKKGKLRTDEYTTQDFIDDVNDLGRTIWTTIFQGVDGNKPSANRSEEVVVLNDLNKVHTRAIKKTPILKVVQDDWTVIDQCTDKTRDLGYTTYEYDDDEIRFKNSIDATYKVFYEAGVYPELTLADYEHSTPASPDWIKEDFLPLFWSYPAFLNTDTRKEEMGGIYQSYLGKFERYYSRTEALETPYMIAGDTRNQL